MGKWMYFVAIVLFAEFLIALPIDSTQASIVLTNPGFDEDTNFPEPYGWTSMGTYATGKTWPHPYARSAPNVIGYWWVKAWTVLYQDFSVNEGLPYEASVYAYSPAEDAVQGWIGKVGLEFPETGTKYESSPFSESSPNNVWVKLKILGRAPEGATTGRIKIMFEYTPAPYLDGRIEFDDASVSVIPEPASILLLGWGLVGLFGLRRKSNKI